MCGNFLYLGAMVFLHCWNGEPHQASQLSFSTMVIDGSWWRSMEITAMILNDDYIMMMYGDSMVVHDDEWWLVMIMTSHVIFIFQRVYLHPTFWHFHATCKEMILLGFSCAMVVMCVYLHSDFGRILYKLNCGIQPLATPLPKHQTLKLQNLSVFPHL